MKNITTPRTLSECEWTSGYPSIPRLAVKNSPVLNVLLATAIGILIALSLAHWWAA
jgi:hypothetical protein